MKNKLINFFGLATKKEIEQISEKLNIFESHISLFDSFDIAFKLRKELKNCGENVKIFAPIKYSNLKNIIIGDNVTISSFVWLHTIESYGDKKFLPNIEIQDNTYIGHYVEIGACNKILIGKNCMIADHVFIADTNHDYQDIEKHISDEITFGDEIIIGDETWIGDGVKILPGAKIGNRCVVGAGSVVNSAIPDFSIAVGAPAKVVKSFNKLTNKWEK